MKIGGDFIDLSKTLMYIMRFWISFGLLLAICNGINGDESGKAKQGKYLTCEQRTWVKFNLVLIKTVSVIAAVNLACNAKI